MYKAAPKNAKCNTLRQHFLVVVSITESITCTNVSIKFSGPVHKYVFKYICFHFTHMKFIQKVTENASNLYLYLNCTIVTIITYYWFGAVHSWLERVGNFANDTFQMHEHNVQSGRGLSDHNITSRFFFKS